MSGLFAAARRELENAEARYRVLAAANAETNALQAQEQQLEGDRAAAATEVMQASAIRDTAQTVGTLLAAAIEAVSQAITFTGEAAGTAQVAQSEALAAHEAATTATRKNSLRVKADALATHHDELEGQRSRLGGNLDDLKANVDPLNTVSTQAKGQVSLLQAKVEAFDAGLADVNSELAAQRPSGDISQAQAERNDAQRTLDDAPSLERQAQEALKSAREAREDAEKRYREALESRDEAEQLFIAGIDVSGPNAAGVFTAKADLIEDLPAGYALVWSSNAGTVNPSTTSKADDEVSFDTGKLRPGSYDIVVHLERTP
jgi:chromosome segregation ATPase